LRFRAGIALAVVALAGCGSSGVSREDYAARGNEICEDARKETEALTRPQIPTLGNLRDPSPRARRIVREWDAYRRKTDEIGRESQDELLALEAPDDLRERRASFASNLQALDQLGARGERISRRLDSAVRRGDRETVELLLEENTSFSRRQGQLILKLRADARALGWHKCAA
jgi:hypothetical protein